MGYKMGVFVTVTNMITNEYIMPEKKPTKPVPIYGYSFGFDSNDRIGKDILLNKKWRKIK